MEKMTKITSTYDRFTNDQVALFEKAIEKHIAKGYQQISISTLFPTKDMQEFATYLASHYPSGTLVKSGNYRNYLIAKKSIKISPKFDASTFNQL